MKNEVQNLLDCLDDARELLENYPEGNFDQLEPVFDESPLTSVDLALFDQWPEIYKPGPQKPPTIRIIQHLACTGGTLISKCLAVMPNVALLSEINPLSQMKEEAGVHSFSPTDSIYLATKSGLPHIEKLRENIFKAEIEAISEHASSFGKYLVLREHSQSDYMFSDAPKNCSTVQKMLEEDYPILSALTVRHPVDCFLSLKKRNWVHYFSPATFDEYCRRYLLFLEHNVQTPVFRYEDLVLDPQRKMLQICDALELPFNEDFQELFDLNVFSGASGRTSNIISPRKRQNYSGVINGDDLESTHYLELCERLKYVEDIDSDTLIASKEY